ncbi:MAG: DUF1015 domain-containing protein [Thermoplasmata archaeon]
MVEIRSFPGIRYDEEKIGSMEKVITQPYDKIPPELQNKYYGKSEYNFCRLILPKEEERYKAAAERLHHWLKENVLVSDKKACIYVYYQRFEVLGKKYTRKGFISAVKLHPFEEGIVLPHEQTHKGPKIDRLNMLKATEKNLEPGFMLYSDPNQITINIFDQVSKEDPEFEVEDEYGVKSRVWKIDSSWDIKKVQEVLNDQQVVIADGHHRYETAVTYRDETRKQIEWDEDSAFNFRMTYMVPIEDPGLVVLPGHRLLLKDELKEEHLRRMKEHFEIHDVDDADEYLSKNKDTAAFVIYDGKKNIGLKLKDRSSIEKFFPKDYSEDYKNLDVVILRDVIFEGIMKTEKLDIDVTIAYERWTEDAVKKVKEGDATVVFLVNATRPEQVLMTAKNGERMPEKSTDFYPKVNSGFVIMDIGKEQKLV